jgi:hypothetical protein
MPSRNSLQKTGSTIRPSQRPDQPQVECQVMLRDNRTLSLALGNSRGSSDAGYYARLLDSQAFVVPTTAYTRSATPSVNYVWLLREPPPPPTPPSPAGHLLRVPKQSVRK